MAVGLRSALEHWDPTLDLLWERGLAHEQASFRHLGGGNLLLKESDVKTTKLIDRSLKVQ